MRAKAEQAARAFADRHFPGAEAVFLGGSAASGQLNERSDLDLLLIDESVFFPYYECFASDGWQIDAFVFSSANYYPYFEACSQTGIPTLLRLCAEGVLIRDGGVGERYRREAAERLAAGPDPWTDDDKNRSRHMISENLYDLESSRNFLETAFVVQTVCMEAARFALRTGGHWIGEGKWLARELQRSAPEFYGELCAALAAYHEHRRIEPLIAAVDKLLEPHGGRLIEGYAAFGVLPGDG